MTKSARREWHDDPTAHPAFPDVPLEILHADDQLVALNKPSGLLSVPGIGPHKQDCLATRVAQAFPGARIVHRLDRDTSGVIVVALDADTHRELSRQFHDREVGKQYITVVGGVVVDDQGVIDLPLRKDLDDPPRHIVDHQHGRPAVTNWRVIERRDDRTRLELTPVTGRSHQLRVHLRELGHPILGDDLYAPPPILALAPRLLLHASRLALTHPATGARLTLRCSAPF